MSERSDKPRKRRIWWPELAIWIALLALEGASSGIATIDMGWATTALNYIIAFLMLLLVFTFSMRLREDTMLVRLTACLGLLWLAIMFTLTLADFLSRGP